MYPSSVRILCIGAPALGTMNTMWLLDLQCMSDKVIWRGDKCNKNIYLKDINI